MIINESPIQKVTVVKINGNQRLANIGKLAIEEPLEIRLAFGAEPNRTVKNISVTLRTPGQNNDFFIIREMMLELPDRLRLSQEVFDVTGGLQVNLE